MAYKVLTSLILVVHFGYLAYVVVGGYLAWRWPRTIWLHLGAAAWGLLAITVPTLCPLTYAEDWSRRQAGEAGLTRGFIDRYIEGVLYPERYTRLLQALAAAAVLVSYIGYFILSRRRVLRRRAQRERPVTATAPEHRPSPRWPRSPWR